MCLNFGFCQNRGEKKKKQPIPILDKEESREGIVIQGGACHKTLELKYDLILKYLGIGIGVNQCIFTVFFSS